MGRWIMANYTVLMPREPVERTLQVNSYLLVDLNAAGRIVGIENLNSWKIDEEELYMILKWVTLDPREQKVFDGS